jgi:hypothetical protein
LLAAMSRNKENKRSRGCSGEKLPGGGDEKEGAQRKRWLLWDFSWQFLFRYFEAISDAA